MNLVTNGMDQRPSPRQAKEGWPRLFGCLLILLLAIVLPMMAEVVLRLAGRTPWMPSHSPRAIEPDGVLYQYHKSLGYTHRPGTFKVTLWDGYAFSATHLGDTLRLTHPDQSPSFRPERPEVWIFGCSFTHGWSLQDAETYPWLLQQALPDFEVRNFGVGGYGTVQSLIQFRIALEERKPPVLAVLAYAPFHDQRNVLSRNWMRNIAPLDGAGLLHYPHVRVTREGTLLRKMAKVRYRGLPWTGRSALTQTLEQVYNDFEERSLNGHAASLELLGEFEQLARSRGVNVVVATIRRGEPADDVRQWARSRHVPTIDISADLKRDENRNLPHDRHPSPRANRAFADTLSRFLRESALLPEPHQDEQGSNESG